MNKSLVTIAIPFYNDEKYLDFAIKSVFAQTYTDWLLILINDGGNDGSLAIAKKYEDDPRVSIYSDGENKQLPYRLNQIAQLTRTKYLARMDADDIMHPERIKTQLEILEKNSDIDVLGSNAYSIDEHNNIISIRMDFNQNTKENLVKVKGFIHPTIMAKTQWFRDNPYDVMAIRIEDGELWYRTVEKYNFKITIKPLLFYREYGGKYYKKYFKTLKTIPYIAKKHKKIKWFIKYPEFLVKGIIYYLYNILGIEQKLINKRGVLIPKNIKDEVTDVLQSLLN